jgi:succinyl-diaminopimelate desuccinylase
VPGAGAGHPVWVMAHTDTVPPGPAGLWDSDPFMVRVEGGKVFGRGVEDNQQGLVAALFALRALVDEGLTPTTDAGVILVADEENGNTYGIEHLLSAAPGLVAPDSLVVVPDFGTPDGSGIEVAEKSILWAEFTVIGRQVHASLPGAGINAHRAASNLVVRLDERLHARFPAADPLFDPPTSTFEPTKREGNVPNVNTVPGRDVFYFDCRVLPCYGLDEVKTEIEALTREIEDEFAVAVAVAYPNEATAAPPTSPDAPVVLALSEAVRRVRGVEPYPMGMGGGTVGAVFRRHGIPAAVWGTMEGMAHQPNESCVIDNMVADALVFAHVFMRGEG